MITRIFILSCLYCLLTGCMSAAMGGANALYDHHSVSNKLENHYLQATLFSQIKNDTRIKQPHDIAVSVINRVVLLTGQVPDANSRWQAESDIRANTEVKMVLNYIEVGPKLSSSQQMEDSWLTTKIKTRIITGNDLDPDEIKIITENGVVYLMGILPRADAQAAINIAKTTDGVKQVVTAIYFLDASTQ